MPSSIKHATRIFPTEYRELFTEILYAPATGRDRAYVEAIVNALADEGSLLHLIHLTGRLIRNLTIDELVIAGDCWDRGSNPTWHSHGVTTCPAIRWATSSVPLFSRTDHIIQVFQFDPMRISVPFIRPIGRSRANSNDGTRDVDKIRSVKIT